MPKGLYIHVPFCRRKCPYCDFYSVTELELAEKYTEAVIRNLRRSEISVDTVYFGGGTPSLLKPNRIYDILSFAGIEENAEITMECNPDSVNPDYLADALSAGINRVSFGVQSLDDSELAALGRIHDAGAAIHAIENAYEAGFRNISADLMLGTAYQTEKSLSETIEKLTALPINHISAYMLKIESDTPYGKGGSDSLPLPDEDETADMYLFTVQRLKEKGFEQYEISNFSQPDCESRHNLKYWRCEEYFGIGPSAHSYIDGVRKACPKSVRDFISSELQQEYITEEHGGDSDERIMLALRLTKEGIDLSSFDEMRRSEIIRLSKPLIAAEYMLQNGNRLTLTPKGCLVSNEIICRIIG
ncbi:MAG: radical SAM family heme chaperone HemW [Oscillospiraceae bacterium]|nr:radical SAM family heme chaperone HemW [Oscillospiraceae bacterium]